MAETGSIEKHTIAVLVENKFGVLSRVAGLFSARGYNIESLSVGETLDPSDGHAESSQAPSQLAGVRVARLADRQLRADAQQFRGQEGSGGGH